MREPAKRVPVIEILLVEDDPRDVRMTEEALRAAKVHNRLTVASDGVEALRILRREGEHRAAPRPDLVLLDLHLPHLDGQGVLAEMKGSTDLRSIPVAVVSGPQTEMDTVGARRLGAACHIRKPVDFHQLIRVVESVEELWLSIVRIPSAS